VAEVKFARERARRSSSTPDESECRTFTCAAEGRRHGRASSTHHDSLKNNVTCSRIGTIINVKKRRTDLLIKKGRILTPLSRAHYRWIRLRRGKTLLAYEEPLLTPVLITLRLATIGLFLAFDVACWPLVRPILARGSWWVVSVAFDGPDARFTRVAEFSAHEAALHFRRTGRDPLRG
jgi:hypothetical protein